MAKGQVEHVPDDGLTTKERRERPITAVHTGAGKGKSTAAFGLALRGWNQGWSIGIFQFVKLDFGRMHHAKQRGAGQFDEFH